MIEVHEYQQLYPIRAFQWNGQNVCNIFEDSYLHVYQGVTYLNIPTEEYDDLVVVQEGDWIVFNSDYKYDVSVWTDESFRRWHERVDCEVEVVRE